MSMLFDMWHGPKAEAAHFEGKVSSGAAKVDICCRPPEPFVFLSLAVWRRQSGEIRHQI
jgi:hypothetical protein